MNKQNYLEFSDLPAQIERREIYSLFKPFGPVNKLYIHPSDRTGKIFLESQEKVEEAYAALNGSPPHCLKLSTPFNNHSGRNSSQNDTSSSQNNGTMNYYNDINDEDDVMADVGPVLVNINGIQVNTLTADNGELYVPLIEVKELGFELFDSQNIPRRLDYDAQLIKEFEMYLAIKARKFMIRRSCKISEGVVDATMQKMKNQVFNLKAAYLNDSRNSNFLPNERKVYDNRSYNQNSAKQFDNRKPEAQAGDFNKPLRKPYANRDGGQRQFGERPPSTNNYERRGGRDGERPPSTNNYERRGRDEERTNNYERRGRDEERTNNYERRGRDEERTNNYERRGRDEERTNNYERRGRSVGRNSFSNEENKGQYGTRNQNKFENENENDSATRNVSNNLVLPKKNINESDSVKSVDTTGMAAETVDTTIIAAKTMNTTVETRTAAETVDTTTVAAKIVDTNVNLVNESRVKSQDAGQSTVFRKTEPTYDQIDLNLNAEVEVEITHVDSKNKYWVSRKDQKDVMHEMLVQTNHNASEASAGQPVVGKICAADFVGLWYRVIILNIQPTLKVLYIDFGNKNTEQIKEIRNLPASLRAIPGQAVCITFENPPSTTLEVGTEMKITPTKKLTDGTYVVTEAVERKVSPLLDELNAQPSGTQFAGAVGLPKADKEIVVNHSTGAIPKNKTNSPSPVLLEAKKTRRSVIESVGSEGQIQCIEIIDDSTFLAFVLPTANIDDLVALEEIGANAKADESFTANIGDLIAVHYEKEDCWARGLVTNLQNGKYTTALVDYAVVTQPVEVCALNKKFVDIPEFSCLCTCKPEVMGLVKKIKGVDIPCSIAEASKIKLQFDNGATCIVRCEKWNPLATNKHEKAPTPSPSPALNKPPLQSSMKIKPVFTDPPRPKTLKQDDIVIIVSNTSKKLLVRTRECNTLHKSIAEEISRLEPQPLKAPPIVNQVVLAAHESSTIRCVIKSIDNNIAEVDFIDHGYQDSVPVSKLKEISESLATKNSSLIPVTLKSFENVEFSTAALKQLEEYSSSRLKFNAQATSEPGVFDLFNAKKESLSEQLLSLGRPRSSTPSTRVPSKSLITYQKLSEPNLSLGSHRLLYTSTEALNKGKIVFMITDEDIMQKFLRLSDEINEFVATDNTPYLPKANEICLALFEDGWYRAQVTAANETSEVFDVYFIDYGNSHRASSKDIRKMPVEFTTTPPVAVNCIFKELMTKEVKGQLLARLQDLLGFNKEHPVEILDIKDSTYTITIPSIVRTLKAEGLL